MSLLRLLTAGRSLVGLKDPTVRYHMTDPRAMPKFAAASNPFRATTRPAAVAKAQPMPANIPVVAAAPPAPKQAKSPVAAGNPSRPAERSGSSRAHDWAGRCASTLRGLVSRPGLKPAPPAPAAAARAPIQGELSLERVRVVRNDLSDADLEIVPARPAAVTQQSPVPLPVFVKTESTSTMWNRVAGRFLSMGKS